MGQIGKLVGGAALAAITIGTGGAAGLAIGFSWSSFAGSLILGGLSYALTPKPKKPAFDNFSNLGNTNVAVRQPDLTRQHVYGHTRVTRGYAHMESTGLNGVLHMILILCEGPVRAINEVWVNDYSIPPDWIDSDGNILQGRYAGFMTIRKHLGELNQAADTNAVANMSNWTANHRLQGTAYLYITMTKNQDVYPTGVPNISAIVEGQEVFDPRLDALSWSTNIALYASDFLQSQTYGYGAFEDDIDLTNVAAQANICDEIVDTENEDTLITAVGTGTDILTLDGAILKYQFGDRVEILAPGTPPGGLSTSTNYYVIPYQIKDTPRIQLATSLDNAMDKVVIDITTAGSGVLTLRKNGEPRYHGGGVFDTDSSLSETMNNLATSMAGRAVCIGGFWTLLAGAYRSPSIELGIGDMRGSGMGFKNCLSMANSYNIVKGLYVSSVNFYQNSDYPAARYQQFIDDDNGLESPKDINLPFTNRATTGQRIAKIELFRGRQDIVFTSDFSTKALQVQPGDNVELTIDRLGWEEKEFEVTDFAFDVNNGALVNRLTLRETAQAIYDWTSGEAIDFDPAPNTNLPNPYEVYVPTGVNYNSRVIDTRDGDVVYALQLEWDLHPDMFVREYGDFELQFRVSTDTEWLPSFFVDGSLTKTDVVNSSVNVPYDLRIRARNNLGVRSAWVTILNAVVGSSGGVTTTEDWETFSDPEIFFEDWETFSDPSTFTEDWGYFT